MIYIRHTSSSNRPTWRIVKGHVGAMNLPRVSLDHQAPEAVAQVFLVLSRSSDP